MMPPVSIVHCIVYAIAQSTLASGCFLVIPHSQRASIAIRSSPMPLRHGRRATTSQCPKRCSSLLSGCSRTWVNNGHAFVTGKVGVDFQSELGGPPKHGGVLGRAFLGKLCRRASCSPARGVLRTGRSLFGWLVQIGPCRRGRPRDVDDRHGHQTPHLVHPNALWQTSDVGGQDRKAVLCFLLGHTTGMVPPRTLLARARTCHFAMEHGLAEMCHDPVLLDTAFRSHKNVGLAKTPNRFRLGRPETETC